MRNIRTFETYEDFLATQEAVSGSGQYVEDIVPGYVYIRDRYLAGESGYTFFNKNNSSGETGGTEYIFGDIIYYDGDSELKNVYWSGWTDSLGTPIGFVVIPEAMAPDGNARMIALTDIESDGGGGEVIKSEEGDSRNLRSADPSAKNNFYWQNRSGNEPDGNVSWYDGYVYNMLTGVSPEYYIITMSNGDQAAMSTDVSGVTENSIADGEYYTSESYPPVVSPYMRESDGINPNYLQENWEAEPPTPPAMAQSPKNEKSETLLGSPNTNYSYNALSDFSGLTWTKLLAVNQEPYSAAQMYSTSGTNAGDWYVPSMGEAGFLQARYRAIAGILFTLFNDSEIYNAYPYEGIYYTSTLNAENDGMKTGATPFVYYADQVEQPGPGPMMSSQPKGETKLGTSYPSDVPVPLFGGYDLGLTRYGTSSPVSAVQPTKGVEEGNTILGSIYTAYVYVRPMAMIKDGHIVTEVGTPEANGHQVSDLNEELPML